jgi:hypothetical protein
MKEAIGNAGIENEEEENRDVNEECNLSKRIS